MNKEEYEFGIREFFGKVLDHVQEYYPEFNCFCKIDWSPKRRASRGGKYSKGYGINLAVRYYFNNESPSYFNEYKSFDKDSSIGGFVYDGGMLAIEAIVCHEVAHALDWFKRGKTNHQEEWKEIYKELREEFINPRIDPKLQKTTVEEKEELDQFYVDCFYTHHKKFGLSKEDLGKEFCIEEEKYQIMGINPRASKYPILALELNKNKIFKLPATFVRTGLANA